MRKKLLINKVLLVILLVHLSLLTSAQMGFEFSGVFGFTRAKSYKGFVELYNQTNGSTLQKQLNAPHFVYGIDIQGDYYFENMYCAVGLTKLYAESQSTIENGGKRHIDLNQNVFCGLLGYGIHDETYEYSMSIGVSMKKSYLHSSFIYPTGDRDYNVGQISGTYSSVGVGFPLTAHFAVKTSFGPWLFTKFQLQVLYFDKFSYFKGTSTANTSSAANYQGYEIVEDNKNVLFEVGVKFPLGQ